MALTSQPSIGQATIAQAAGYSDQSHFSREFKRTLGMNPVEFKGYVGKFHTPTLPIWHTLNRELEARKAGRSFSSHGVEQR